MTLPASTAQDRTGNVSGKKIRNIQRSKRLVWELIAREASLATAPVAQPALDSAPQAPEAAG